MILISLIISIFIILIGYLYGKIFSKYIPLLNEINSILIGVFAIFGLFQLFVFVAIPFDLNVNLYLIWLFFIISLSPILCFALKVDIKPCKEDIYGLLLGLLFCVILTLISMPLNTGSMYFDSTFYLSKVIESSSSDVMAHVSNYSGSSLFRIDALYDFQGYYYFWGVILKIIRNIFSLDFISLTPIYIWSASFIYFTSLGLFIYMSYKMIIKKINYKIVIVILFIFPYFSNYFNTTLGFFGNSIKTISVGLIMLIIYAYFKTKNNRFFLLLILVHLAGLSFSSSMLFLSIFIIIALFFAMIFLNIEKMDDYLMLILSSFPVLIYIVAILTNWAFKSIPLACLITFVYAGLMILCSTLKKSSEKIIITFLSILKIVFFIILILMCIVPFVLPNLKYNYSFYFELRSLNDMTLNFTNWINNYELARNSILWLLLILALFNINKARKYMIFIVVCIALFLTPLTMPVIASFITDIVYSRSFEIIVNPFVLIFLLNLSIFKIQTKFIKYLLAGYIVITGLILSYNNAFIPYSRFLLNDDKYNWEYKVSDQEYEMFNHLIEELVNNGLERPLIISQSTNLKGYVPNIRLLFSTIDWRTMPENGNDVLNQVNGEALLLFSPRTEIYDEIAGIKPDYSRMCPVMIETGADYLVMQANLMYPNENGDYVPIWWDARACSDSIFDNKEWVILKMRK